MRRTLTGVLALITAVVALSVIAVYLRHGGVPQDVVLLAVHGDVRVVGLDASPHPAAVGGTLSAQDHVMTGPSGGAIVGVGGVGRLELGPSTEVEVTAVDRDSVDVELYGGRLTARVLPDSRSVRVSSAGRAIAMTDTTLRVAVTDGALVAQVDAGTAQVEGVLGVDALGAGERLVAPPQGRASLGPMDGAFLLSVEWPDTLSNRDATITVSGKTRPFSQVRIAGAGEGAAGRADEHGHFDLQVPLSEGVSEVAVHATDPLGEDAVTSGTLHRDSSGPRFSGAVEYRR